MEIMKQSLVLSVKVELSQIILALCIILVSQILIYCLYFIFIFYKIKILLHYYKGFFYSKDQMEDQLHNKCILLQVPELLIKTFVDINRIFQSASHIYILLMCQHIFLYTCCLHFFNCDSLSILLHLFRFLVQHFATFHIAPHQSYSQSTSFTLVMLAKLNTHPSRQQT